MTALLLFGAFDRHNFGDLLFPHVAATLLPGEAAVFAGLADRDLRACGGHAVRGVASLAMELGGRPVRVLHVGGELLTCSAWEAAVMLCPPDEVHAHVARFGAQPEAGRTWAARELGFSARAPYCLPKGLLQGATRVVYAGVGGVALDACEPAMRAEVLASLAAAELVTVRDACTHAQLRAAAIAAELVPDPASMVAELFGARITRHAAEGEPARVRAAFPGGYLAVQFSADFGDDATLDALAAELARTSSDTGLGIVLFRAGAAPWHDSLECYQRLTARMGAGSVRVFLSLNLWDICALIAASRGFAGSSLHGRILAMAYGLPRVGLRPPGETSPQGKQAAYAATWDAPQVPGVLGAETLAAGLDRALSLSARVYDGVAEHSAQRYREAFAAMRNALG